MARHMIGGNSALNVTSKCLRTMRSTASQLSRSPAVIREAASASVLARSASQVRGALANHQDSSALRPCSSQAAQSGERVRRMASWYSSSSFNVNTSFHRPDKPLL
jgi:hypothetical protein